MAGSDDTAAPTPSSIFFANPTTPQQQQLSYPALLMRQQIALRLAAQRRPYPRNIGEGIANLGESLGERRMMQELDAQDRMRLAQQQADQQRAAPLLLGGAGAGTGPGAVRGPAAAPPAAVAPAARPPVAAAPPPAAAVVPVRGYAPSSSSFENIPLDPAVVTPNTDAAVGGVPDNAADMPPSFDGRFAGSQRPMSPDAIYSGGENTAMIPNVARMTPNSTIFGGPDAGYPPASGFRPNASTDDLGSSSPQALPSNVGDAGDGRLAIALTLQNQGTAQGVPQPNPTDTGSEAPATSDQSSPDDLALARRNAIGGIESGGRRNPYATVVDTGRGDAVYGRYGIKGSNIPAWTQAALGQPLTPQQFLADPNAQDATFDHRMGTYADKYGEEGAGRAWYAGEHGMNNPNATDRFGRLTVANYGQDYLNRLQQQQGGDTESSGSQGSSRPVQVASLDPTMAFAAAAPAEAADNPPIPTDIAPAPVQVAQMQERRPTGPLDKPAPLPPVPGTGLPMPESASQVPRKPPTLVPAPPDPAEIEAYRLSMGPYGMAPETQLLVKQLQDAGMARRVIEDAARRKAYDTDMAIFQKQTEERTSQAQFKFTNEREEQARKDEEYNRFGPSGRAPYEQEVQKSADAKAGLAGAMQSVEKAKAIIDANPQAFGGTAEAAQQMNKFLQNVGFAADKNNTAREQFQAYIAHTYNLMRKEVVGGAQQSNVELKNLQASVGANITLEPGSIKAILSNLQQMGLYDAVRHQERIEGLAGNNPNLQGMYQSRMGLPMYDIVPIDAVRALRSDPSPQARIEFDNDFHTPGLAAKVLAGKRGVQR